MDQNPNLWLKKVVVQRRGWVLDAKDADNLIKDGYYVLDKSARGNVVSVNPATSTCDVRFTDLTGWRRIELSVKRRLKTVRNYDDYGNVFIEQWIEEGLRVVPADHGKLLNDANAEGGALVRFPLKTLGMPPPSVGETVVRGPDWPANRRVDGCNDGESMDPCTGTVVSDIDGDFYLLVKWHKTGLKEKHRFDCRRYYDVLLSP